MNRPELRIGDLERDAAVSALADHYAAGRITKDEYDARADVAWGARTRSDLLPLFADLPPLPRPQRVPEPPRPQDRSGSGRVGGRPRPPVLPVLLGVVVVAAVSGLEVWPLLLLGLVYLWLRAWMGLTTARRWLQGQARGWRGASLDPWRRPTTWS